MVIHIPVGFELEISLLVIDEATYIVKDHFIASFEFFTHSCHKLFHDTACIAISDTGMTGNPSNQKTVIMIQVPVERDLFDRRIKSGGALINTGRGVIPYEAAKTRHNDAVVAEKQFPYERGDIH